MRSRRSSTNFVQNIRCCLVADSEFLQPPISIGKTAGRENSRSIFSQRPYIPGQTPKTYHQPRFLTELKDECLENLQIFIDDFHRLLCDNYPCQHGGKCSVRPTLEMITFEEHEMVYELITQPDAISISMMPKSSSEHLLKFTDAMLHGEFGDPLLLMDSMNNGTV